MRTVHRSEVEAVLEAQGGNRQALEDLVGANLPLVYTLVQRAIPGHPEVDDIVQDTMVRAVRDLRSLRSPESFRPWLMAIAVRQIGTHVSDAKRSAERSAPLEDVFGLADEGTAVEDVAALKWELSGQRRQVARAGLWLDPDDRTLLSVWWLETAGWLTRAELASAFGVSVPHAAVRVQRMRDRLEQSRTIVAALDAHPRCGQLDVLISDWDGEPSSVWRKRIARHVRDCDVCGGASKGMLSAEQLLVPFGLLAVPVTLAALVTKSAVTGTAATLAVSHVGAVAGGKWGLLSQLSHVVAGHPIVATVAAAAVAAGSVASVTAWTPTPQDRPSAVGSAPRAHSTPTASAQTTQARSAATPVVSSPSSTPTKASVSSGRPAAPSSKPSTSGVLALGRSSLESGRMPGQFIAAPADGYFTVMESAAQTSALAARQRASFDVVPGLADKACFSLRTDDGRYVRHQSWRLRLSTDDGTALLREDATFCPREGGFANSLTLESWNYPGWFIHRRQTEIWVDQTDNSSEFRLECSFRVLSPLEG